MPVCSRCGEALSNSARQCLRCGAHLNTGPQGALSPAATCQPSPHRHSPAKPRVGQQTLIGVARVPAPSQEPTGRSPVTPSAATTLFGLAPVAAQSPGPANTPPPRPPAPKPLSERAPPKHAAAQAPTRPAPRDEVESTGDPAPAVRGAHEPDAPHGHGQSRSGWVLLGLSGALMFGLGAFALFGPPTSPLLLTLEQSNGGEELRLQCGNCPPGTQVKFGARKAEFREGIATIALSAALPVGEQAIRVDVDRPGWGQDETLQFTLPVNFRLKADRSGLGHTPSTVAWSLQAVPGTEATLNDRAYTLGVEPILHRQTVDVEGPSAQVSQATRALEYTVKPPGEPAESGRLEFAYPVTPLLISSPGPRTVTTQVALRVTGQSGPGARITIGPRAVVADEAGAFSLEVPLPAGAGSVAQPLTVAASLPGHAARTSQLSIRHVGDLAAEAAHWPPWADVAQLRGAEATVGVPVSVRGLLEEVRVDAQRQTALLRTPQCSRKPCLVRLVYQGPVRLVRKRVVRAFGVFTRQHHGAGGGSESIPEVDVSFTLRGLR